MTKTVILSSAVVFLVIIIIGLFITIQSTQIQQVQASNTMGQKITRMSFSSFDRELAIEMMDNNKDGKCDSCGMPVEMCIDSGELHCSMDPKSTIGKLGSQHIHADWKIYLDGKQFDWSLYADRHERQMHGDTTIKDTSAFIHIHPTEPPEKAGDILHMHATGVPLWIFFKSLDLELPENVKMYVNGKQVQDWKNYVFTDLDKILITDGGNLEEQIKSITDFAKDH